MSRFQSLFFSVLLGISQETYAFVEGLDSLVEQTIKDQANTEAQVIIRLPEKSAISSNYENKHHTEITLGSQGSNYTPALQKQTPERTGL